MQAWSSLGWGNWIQVFHFPGKCCSHFSLHSRQTAAQQPLVPPLNLVRTLLPEVWITGAETHVWAPREPGGKLWRPPSEVWCQLTLPVQTLEPNMVAWSERGQLVGTYCCMAWIIWKDTLGPCWLSSVSVPLQIPVIITTASLPGLILGSLAIFPQAFNVILCSESLALALDQ